MAKTIAERRREYRERHPERWLKQTMSWRERNREHYLEYQRNYHKSQKTKEEKHG